MKFFKKWYTYQKERFPVITYGLYILTIVFAVCVFCGYQYGIDNKLWVQGSSSRIYCYSNWNLSIFIVLFVVSMAQMLMVRIIDEFKDYEEDCKFRAYRPVPRGLVSLKELKVLFIICILVQIILTFIFKKTSFIYLIIVWIFFAIMSKGFFIKKFLDDHILCEVLLDELIMPLMVLYLASYIYINKNIWLLLLLVYVISWIIEIARKMRCKEAEEEGVKTYTAVFGIKNATILLTFLEFILLIIQIIILKNAIKYNIILFCAIAIINLIFAIRKTKKCSKMVEYGGYLYAMLTNISMFLIMFNV